MAEPTYTVYVRVPIPRGDFVDPPQVHWDSSRDEDLWKILSGASQTDPDWHQVFVSLSGRGREAEMLTSRRALGFQVPVDFLLQQVAFLTERHASQVRAQVRKATAAARGSAAPSPIPSSDHPRTTSALSVQRDSPIPRHDAGVASSLPGSGRQAVSRNTSTHTVGPRDASGASVRLPATGAPPDRRRLSSLPIPPTPPATVDQRRALTPGPAVSATATSSDEDDDDEDDDDDDDDNSSPAQSRIIRRPPRFQQAEAAQAYRGAGGDGDSEEGSEPAFQPYHPTSDVSGGQDLASTLKGDGRIVREGAHQGFRKDATLQSHMSDSSAGSGANLQRPNRPREQKTAGPRSPRRAVGLRGKGKAVSHEGSDGTPSMGSSFSDLDDSVTQSALEEALASHMNRGAISSRFSITQAFRSRYNTGPGQ
ncbi:hypothetical protein CDD80_3684 [Ophiocordyceps camponoti-rufipedis]|uniref:Autophagy-related protein 29 n=1 Tax=Ophiocordyceps camponoti-rufipedis TaxID=2004952 RepID=A0A2C5ZIZ0_9HYPO|nr:hypothetical protein CDD80_3684 [Ophiocordyceps camponoti-rufipedis]